MHLTFFIVDGGCSGAWTVASSIDEDDRRQGNVNSSNGGAQSTSRERSRDIGEALFAI